jgi:hypothetical protein
LTGRPEILVIDDESTRLIQLTDALQTELGEEAVVKAWQPTSGEDPLARFEEEVTDELRLVATDQDLTKGGTGLLGSSIASWAQDRYLPVCNFSRQQQRRLPRERNFFELRIPKQADESRRAAFLGRVFRGFSRLREHIDSAETGAPMAQVLAGAMGVPRLADELAPFLTSVGFANTSLMQSLHAAEGPPTGRERTDFLSFLLGHVLLNAVLEFPGPILSRTALAAYCATGPDDSGPLGALFVDATYTGPFAEPGEYFIRRMVDARIDELAAGVTEDASESDQYNRAIVAAALGTLHPHSCPRCDGMRGGYWCPFMERAVCNRDDCSVLATAWIPKGASLCRVEKDHYDEWSPLLGS